MNLQVVRYFNLNQNPPVIWTTDMQDMSDLVLSAIRQGEWIAIGGAIGSGKTTLVNRILEGEENLFPVRVTNPDRTLIKSSTILNAIVYQAGPTFISTSNPRRDQEARMAQVQRIIQSASISKKTSKLVLIIEEAHQLHGQTLKSIKTLRDQTFHGRKNLMACILVGQPELKNKLGSDPEVGLRSGFVPYHVSTEDIMTVLQNWCPSPVNESLLRSIAKHAQGSILMAENLFMNGLETAMYRGAEGLASLQIEDFDLKERPKVQTREQRIQNRLNATQTGSKAG